MNVLYVANRGEIARRIIRSAKKLNFRVAVGFSNQDVDLPFVREADEAVPLDGEDALETYLNIPKVLSAAKKAKATHIHPGYGFLSENPKFVDLVKADGIQFVGPSSESMRTLGDKIGSRNFLKKIGIPLLPSYDGDDQSEGVLLEKSVEVGFPLLIKPSAGGGGKGMIRVDRVEDFAEALQSSRRVAKSAFNDERVFLERFIECARHIEVQILGDHKGNVYTIGERECSLQKRHQKVIEEAPCVFLPDSVRKEIFECSERIAKRANYFSLGTVEWIWDGKEGIYFLEVNARLQVEHPVTELVWNIDLVELQLKVALGESLKGFSLSPKGHAIEARICAEDPEKEFLPSGGKIHRLKLPTDARVDFGYAEKNSIPPQFDSLMGKIISYGTSRMEATERLLNSLKSLSVFGPATNRAYLIQLLKLPEFEKGELSTALIGRTPYKFSMKDGFQLLKNLKKQKPAISVDEDLDIFSPWGAVANSSVADSDSFQYEDFAGRRYFHSEFLDWSAEKPRLGMSQSQAGRDDSQDAEVRSPMPARVIKVFVKKGDSVKKGDVVLVLEAMKMEHQIKAARDATVDVLTVKEGDRIQVDGVLIKWGASS